MYIVFRVGASADIEDKERKTPMQWAEKKLANQSDPEQKQRNEKVHDDAHTITPCSCQWMLT